MTTDTALALLAEALQYVNDRHTHYVQSVNESVQDVPCKRCELAYRITALLDSAPDAYAVRNDQGFYSGVWRDLETAQSVLAKGQPSHNEVIVPMLALPPLPKGDIK